MIDLSKPIEAYHPTKGVVPVILRDKSGPGDSGSWAFRTTKAPAGESNEYWKADGSCSCRSTWIVRNVRPNDQPDFTDEQITQMWELLKDASLGNPVQNRSSTFVRAFTPKPVVALAKSLHCRPEDLTHWANEHGVELKYD